MLKLTTCSSLLGAACAVGFGAVCVPAFGAAPGGFTVMGHNGAAYGAGPSVVVSYRDLDLTTKNGRVVLRQRVWKTAETLCARLGEDHAVSASQVGSCEVEAYSSAASQVHDAIARATAPTFDGALAAGPSVLTMRVAAGR